MIRLRSFLAAGALALSLSTASLAAVGAVRLGDISALAPQSGGWALMILGFGSAGTMLRYARRMAVR